MTATTSSSSCCCNNNNNNDNSTTTTTTMSATTSTILGSTTTTTADIASGERGREAAHTPTRKSTSPKKPVPAGTTSDAARAPTPGVWYARGSRVWWWGAMLLSMCLVSLGVWLMGISGLRPRTKEVFDRLKGHWGHALGHALVFGICSFLPGMLVMTRIIQASCRNVTAADTTAKGVGVAGGALGGGTARAPYASVALGVLDRQTVKVAGKWWCVFVATLTIGVAVMGMLGPSMAILFTSLFGALYLLPRQAARWLVEEGREGGEGWGLDLQGPYRRRGRKLCSILVRSLFAGAPLVVLQLNLDKLLRIMSAQKLRFFYPYLLSYVEFLIVTRIFTPRAVKGHSDEALSIGARFFVAPLEAGRVALMVVTYTTGAGTYQGFVLATLNSALTEVLARTGFLSMIMEALKLQYNHGWSLEHPRPPFRLLPLSGTMTRFERVYLGCKTNTVLWPVYGLVIMGVLGHGLTPPANDPVTGELLPALRCGVDVLAVVLAGELVTEACTFGVAWAVGRWCPEYSLHIVSVRPHSSFVVTLLMWWHVGMLTLNALAGSGSLVQELLAKNSGGGGGGEGGG